MEDEYDKLVKLKTKGELSGYDEKFHGRNHFEDCAAACSHLLSWTQSYLLKLNGVPRLQADIDTQITASTYVYAVSNHLLMSKYLHFVILCFWS